MNELLKDFFTININCRLFIPTVTEDEKYYHLTYTSKLFGTVAYAVTKSSYMKSIKRMLKDELYNLLKEKGIY